MHFVEASDVTLEALEERKLAIEQYRTKEFSA